MPGLMWRAERPSTSDRLDLFFLVREHLVDLLDVAVGQLLHLVGLMAMLVLRDLVILLGLLQCFHAVAADVADRNAALLGVLVRKLGELDAPLARELGYRDANELTVRRRIEAEPCLTDGLGGRDHKTLVPDIDREKARLRGAHRSDLVERHALTVSLDHDGIEQVDRGTPGPDPGKLLLERVHRAMHALFEFVEVRGHVSPRP